MDSQESLKGWLNAQRITGYIALAVERELFGYPPFSLPPGSVRRRQQLRPIVDKLLAWALTAEDVETQLRKTYISPQTARRKFAQITPTNRTSIDVFLRIDVPDEERLEKIKAREDPFDRRLRLQTVDDVDASLIATLSLARDDSH